VKAESRRAGAGQGGGHDSSAGGAVALRRRKAGRPGRTWLQQKAGERLKRKSCRPVRGTKGKLWLTEFSCSGRGNEVGRAEQADLKAESIGNGLHISAQELRSEAGAMEG
jgi:hypothetical protein